MLDPKLLLGRDFRVGTNCQTGDSIEVVEFWSMRPINSSSFSVNILGKKA